MTINEFNELEGMAVATRQPFVLMNVRVPDILRDVRVQNELVGRVVPLYNARDYINLEDPNVHSKVVGFGLIKENRTVEMKIISTMMKNLIGQYKGRNFDQSFDIIPSGSIVRTSDKHRSFDLNHFKIRNKPLVKEEVTTSDTPHPEFGWNKEYEDVIDIREGEVYIEKLEEFQKVLGEYVGKGGIKIRARKGYVVIEKI
jgi:hypothetical protein